MKATRLATSLTLGCALLVTLVVGCTPLNQSQPGDDTSDRTFIFSILHEAGEGTRLAQDAGALRVIGDERGNKEVTLNTEGATQVDVHFKGVDLREGGVFEAEFVSVGSEQPFARLRHRNALQGGLLEADVPGASSAIVEFIRDGEVLHRTVATPISGTSTFNLASSNGTPDSVHYIEEHGTTRVVFDWDDTPDGPQMTATDSSPIDSPTHVAVVPQFDAADTPPVRTLKGIKLIEKSGTTDLVITKGKALDQQ